MPVTMYVDYGKGTVKLGSARMIGNKTIDLKDVKLGQPLYDDGGIS